MLKVYYALVPITFFSFLQEKKKSPSLLDHLQEMLTITLLCFSNLTFVGDNLRFISMH